MISPGRIPEHRLRYPRSRARPCRAVSSDLQRWHNDLHPNRRRPACRHAFASRPEVAFRRGRCGRLPSIFPRLEHSQVDGDRQIRSQLGTFRDGGSARSRAGGCDKPRRSRPNPPLLVNLAQKTMPLRYGKVIDSLTIGEHSGVFPPPRNGRNDDSKLKVHSDSRQVI